MKRKLEICILTSLLLAALGTGCGPSGRPTAPADDPCDPSNTNTPVADAGGAASACGPQDDTSAGLGNSVENASSFDDNFGNNENEKGGFDQDPTAKQKQTELAATAKQDQRALGRSTASGGDATSGSAAAGAGAGKVSVPQTEVAASSNSAGSSLGKSGSAPQESMETIAPVDPNAANGSAGFASAGGGSVSAKTGDGSNVFDSILGKGGAGSDAGGAAAGAPGISFGIGEGTKDPFDPEAYLARNGNRSLFDVVNQAYSRKSPDILKHR